MNTSFARTDDEWGLDPMMYVVCSIFIRKCDNKNRTQDVKSLAPVRKEHSKQFI